MGDSGDEAGGDGDTAERRRKKKEARARREGAILRDKGAIEKELERINAGGSNSGKQVWVNTLKTKLAWFEENQGRVRGFDIFHAQPQRFRKHGEEDEINKREKEKEKEKELPPGALLMQSEDGRFLPVGGLGGVPLPPPQMRRRAPSPPPYAPPRYGLDNPPPRPFDERFFLCPPPPPLLANKTTPALVAPASAMPRSLALVTPRQYQDDPEAQEAKRQKLSAVTGFVPASVKRKEAKSLPKLPEPAPANSRASKLPLPPPVFNVKGIQKT